MAFCEQSISAKPKYATPTQELPRLFHLVDKDKGIYRCLYCEKKAKRE